MKQLIGLILFSLGLAQAQEASFPVTSSLPQTVSAPRTELVVVEVEVSVPAQIEEKEAQAGAKILLGKEAFRQVVNEALVKIGQDPAPFWKSYDLQMAVDAATRSLEWDEEFKKSGEGNREFFLEKKRAIHYVVKGKLKENISRYSIKGLNRLADPPLRYRLALEAEVDIEKLEKSVAYYCRPKVAGKIPKLFFTPTYEIKEASWADLGFENDLGLSQVLSEDWRLWLERALLGVVTEVELKNPAPFLQMKDLGGMDLKDELAEIGQSFWLKLNLQAQKVEDRPLVKMRKFLLSGELLLYRMKDNKLILSEEFNRLPLTLSYHNAVDLPLKAAKAMALIPQDALLKVAETIKIDRPLALTQKLIVRKLESFQDVGHVKKFILERLGQVITEVRTVSFSLGQAVIDVTYTGTATELSRQLLGLARGSLTTGKRIDFPDPHDPYTLELR